MSIGLFNASLAGSGGAARSAIILLTTQAEVDAFPRHCDSVGVPFYLAFLFNLLRTSTA